MHYHRMRWLALSLVIALTAASAPSSAAPGRTRLTMWTFLAMQSADPRSSALKSTVEGFNNSQARYEVQVQTINFGRIDNDVIQATAAGQGPDILNVYTDLLPMHVAAHTIVPLDDLFAKLSDAEKKDFVMPLSFTTFDGHLMAIPWETRVWLLWYRRDLLAKAGVGMPRTLDDLARVAGKVSGDQAMGFAVGASEGELGAGAVETFLPLLWAAGGDLLDESGRAVFNSPAGVRVLTYFRDLVTNYHGMRPSVVSMTADDVYSAVRAGTVAMILGGSYRLAGARSSAATGDNLQTAPIPGWTSDKPSPARLAGQTLTIGANTRDRQGAWQFIMYYIGAQSQIAFARAGVMPSRLSVYKNSFFHLDPTGIEMQRWNQYAHAYGRLARTPSDFPELTKRLARAIQEVLLRGADPRHALNGAVEGYNAQHKR